MGTECPICHRPEPLHVLGMDPKSVHPDPRPPELCKFCNCPAVAGCDDQCERCFAENSLSDSGGY